MASRWTSCAAKIATISPARRWTSSVRPSFRYIRTRSRNTTAASYPIPCRTNPSRVSRKSRSAVPVSLRPAAIFPAARRGGAGSTASEPAVEVLVQGHQLRCLADDRDYRSSLGIPSRAMSPSGSISGPSLALHSTERVSSSTDLNKGRGIFLPVRRKLG